MSSKLWVYAKSQHNDKHDFVFKLDPDNGKILLAQAVDGRGLGSMFARDYVIAKVS